MDEPTVKDGKTEMELLAPKLQKLQEELKIDKTALSRNIQKHRSASDNRKSSEQIGMVGLTVLSIVLGLIVLIEVISIRKHIETVRKIHGVHQKRKRMTL